MTATDYINPVVLAAAFNWRWTPGEGFWTGGRYQAWVPEQEPPAFPWLGVEPRPEEDA